MFLFSLDTGKSELCHCLYDVLPLVLCELVWSFAAAYHAQHRSRLMAVDLALQFEDSLCTGQPDNLSHGLNLARFLEAHPEEANLANVGDATMFRRVSPDPRFQSKLLGFTSVESQVVARELKGLWTDRKGVDKVLTVGDLTVYTRYCDYDYDIWACVEGDYGFLCHLERSSWSWGITTRHPGCACEPTMELFSFR